MRNLIGILALVAITAGCSGAGGAQSKGREAPLVTAAAVESMRFVERIDAVGTARANEQVTLAAPVTERITRLNFDDGAFVQRGQIIAVLAAGQENAQLAEAGARSREARQQLNRLEQLKSRGFATNSAVDAQT
ncbi:MAG: biotin/lipoyl-binding protein, partial [Sphingomonadales bacterium]